MEIQKTSIKNFLLKNENYFKIPEFQRPYTWGQLSVDQYIKDIENVIKDGKIHFFGSVVFVYEPKNKMVIDGQQRLTTTFLFLAAIYHLLNDKILEEGIHTAQKIKNQILYAEFGETHDNRPIILRTVTTDDKVFEFILKNPKGLKDDHKANKQYKAFHFFYNYLKDKGNLDKYFDALDKLEIVTIALTDKDDDP